MLPGAVAQVGDGAELPFATETFHARTAAVLPYPSVRSRSRPAPGRVVTTAARAFPGREKLGVLGAEVLDPRSRRGGHWSLLWRIDPRARQPEAGPRSGAARQSYGARPEA